VAVARERKKPRDLLDAARDHQEALEAAGLPAGVVERYETALRGLEWQGRPPSAAAQVLVRDIQREVEEFQAAIRKEFSGNVSYQSVFKAQEPMPSEPREVLALGRHVEREAPLHAQSLIKYALNAATLMQLNLLCEQLATELGAAGVADEARALEEQIVRVARTAFAGRPGLADFVPK
jgi:hypothetical protein